MQRCSHVAVAVCLLLALAGCGGEPAEGCRPLTCEEQGKGCGIIDDGCGLSLQCGACAAPLVCSVENVCADPVCPSKQCTLGSRRCVSGGLRECVLLPDGCPGWGSLQQCPGGEVCSADRCAASADAGRPDAAPHADAGAGDEARDAATPDDAGVEVEARDAGGASDAGEPVRDAGALAADTGDGPGPDAQGVAGPDAAGCGPCDSPPTACHGLSGACVNGRCEYPFVSGAACDDGNPCTVADVCEADACHGTPLLCDTPPADVCLGSWQLRSYDQTGLCQGGRCVYNSQSVTCQGGPCSNGACQTDPCAAMSCDVAPGVCFRAAGVCSGGHCSYPFDDGAACDDGDRCTEDDSCQTGVCAGVPKTCSSAPDNVCENAATLRVYSSGGTCSLGQCSYPYSFASCLGGCAHGACASTGWTLMTSNVSVDLISVWAASASSVWAGGAYGTLVHFNGAQWQVRQSGTSSNIIQIHGTGPSNVFAVSEAGEVLHFDGSAWSKLAVTWPYSKAKALFATGPKDALVFGNSGYAGSTGTLFRLQHQGGAWQVVTLAASGFRSSAGNIRLWAQSPDSVYLPGGTWWNGATMADLGGPTYAPDRLWAAGSLVLGIEQGDLGYTYLREFSAAQGQWVPVNTGAPVGRINDLHGSSSARVFAVASVLHYDHYQGHVYSFDGVGWTDQLLPEALWDPLGVWALPSGEVFVVGPGGAIAKGP